MSEYSQTYATGFPNLGSGAAATLVLVLGRLHRRYPREVDAGRSASIRSRCNDSAIFGATGEQRNVVASRVRDAAEAHGRKFYIMYDISGWSTFQADLKADWTTHIITALHLTSSPTRAQNGKPGRVHLGPRLSRSPGHRGPALDVINLFKGQGCYVIGGVGNDWRTADGTRWSKAGFLAAFHALNAISPWMVGCHWRRRRVGRSTERTTTRATSPTCNARGKRLPAVRPARRSAASGSVTMAISCGASSTT